MLTVTEKAAAVLHQTLDDNVDDDSNQVLRLAPDEKGLSLSLDQEREGDQVITHEERAILVVDGTLAEALTGVTVDSVETSEGEQLVLQEPGEGLEESTER